MQNKIFALTTLMASTVTLAQELPNPNPAPQADGTQIWYVGNNTQYPVIQDVLAACSDGDEIVVNGAAGAGAPALYVESLMIDNKDMLTLRPRVRINNAGTSMEFDNVAFLNPTQGFNNDNKYAMHIKGSRGSYIGNPRSVNELLNGQEAIVVLDDQAAFSLPAAANTVTTRINQGGADQAFTFRSRSFDDVSILLDGSSCTISDCGMAPQQGVGGGVMAYNGDNSSLVACTITGFTSTGNAHAISGLPVCAVSMKNSTTTMSGCTIDNNFAANSGIVNLDGGAPRFEQTAITRSNAQASLGTVMGSGGSAEFIRCAFGTQATPDGNTSNLGTIYWDASASTGMYAFTQCDFDNNLTAETTQGWGEIAYVVDSTATGAAVDPKISFSGCEYATAVAAPGPYGTMAGNIPEESAIYTPYLPEYRLHSDWGDSALGNSASGLNVVDNGGNGVPGDVDGNAAVDFADLDALMSLLGTCQYDPTRDGEIGFADVLSILNSWGEICE